MDLAWQYQWTIATLRLKVLSLKLVLYDFEANMKSYKQLETAAIFFLANLFLKQGIG